MLALVDGVPRTLTLDEFVTHWIAHQIEVIERRTRYRLRKAEERAHILRGLLKALDAHRRGHRADPGESTSASAAQGGLMSLLDIDELQAARDPRHAAAPARRPRAPEASATSTTS